MRTVLGAALAAAAALAVSAPVRAADAPAQVTLIMSSMAPGQSGFSTRFFRPWAEKITAASNGTLNVDVRDGFALATFGNVIDRVSNDVIQIGFSMQGIIGNRFPLTEVAAIPFEADNAVQSSVALWRVYASGGPLAAEYKGLRPLGLGTFPMNALHYAKKPKTLDNLDGLKVRAASKSQGEWISHLGGAPISLDAPELYSALQRGTIDATLQAWSAFGPLHLAEVTFYHLDVGFGTSTIMLFMAQKKYDALPEAGKKAIDANSGEPRSRAWGAFIDETAAESGKKVLATPGHERMTLTAAQLDTWRKRVAPVTEEWIKANPGADKVYAAYRAELAKLKAEK
jgi:TRAP-type C4-dicarboxylate transport system substrate-binding protein